MRRVLLFTAVVAILADHSAHDGFLLQTALAQVAAASAAAIPLPASAALQESPAAAAAETDEQQIVRAVIEDFSTNPRLEKLRTLLGQPDQKELLLIRQSPVTWPFEALRGISGWDLKFHEVAPLRKIYLADNRFNDPREQYPETKPRALGLRLIKLELDTDGGWFVELQASKLGWDDRDEAAVTAAKAHWERIVVLRDGFGERAFNWKNFDEPKTQEMSAMMQSLQLESYTAARPKIPREAQLFYDGKRPLHPDGVKLLAFAFQGERRLDEDETALFRRIYRFRSLRPRLAYERRSDSDAANEEDAATPSTMKGLGRQAAERQRALRILHYENAKTFMSNPGFGINRIPPSPYDLVPLHASPMIALDTGPDLADYGPGRAITLYLSGSDASRVPSQKVLQDYHSHGQEIFLSDARMGYFENIDRVAGFDSHKFWRKPTLGRKPPERSRRRFDESTHEFDLWRTTQLQLVSLLKFAQPAVYVSDHMPNMQELAEAPTRPLDAFEEKSLKALQGGESVVFAATTNRIRMLGALKARNDCTFCHSVKEGTLLGAFTYTLLRDPPLRTTEEPAAPLLQADKAAPLAEISK